MGADFRADEKCHLALLAAEASPSPPARSRSPLSCPAFPTAALAYTLALFAFALDNPCASGALLRVRRMTIGA